MDLTKRQKDLIKAIKALKSIKKHNTKFLPGSIISQSECDKEGNLLIIISELGGLDHTEAKILLERFPRWQWFFCPLGEGYIVLSQRLPRQFQIGARLDLEAYPYNVIQ